MKPLEDYSHIKGFNYSLAPLDKFDPAVEDRNMGYAQRITLNSARVFMHMGDWQKAPEQFLENLKTFMDIAWKHGISTTPILLMPYFTEGQTPYWIHKEGEVNSEIPGCYFEENYPLGEAYVSAIIEKVKDHPGLLFWDVMNEPSWHGFLLSASEDEKEKRYDMMWKFVRHFTKLVREKDPVNALGIGHTFIEDTEYSQTGDMVDVIIFHDYLETRSRVDATCRRAVELSEKYGKPVINNETGCLCRANPYEVAVSTCMKYHIGYYLFELMISEGMWQKVHGIFYPDGTVRDPSIVAAIMGCFRNRGESAVYPDVNMEGMADKAIANAKAVMDRRDTPEEMLEAAEWMANLLEAGELIPMARPMTADIEAFRRQENPDYQAVRAFTYKVMQTLKQACEIF